MPRSSRNSTDSSLKHAHSRLEDGIGRVAHTGVDIAILRPGKLARAIRGISEVVRAGLVQRQSSRAVRRVGLLTSVDTYCLPFWGPG